MRKLWTILVVLCLVFGLAACGDEGNVQFPKFSEKNVVELSAEQMVELFTNIDYSSVDSETVKIATKGHVFVKEIDDDSDDIVMDMRMSVDAVLYALISESIDDVQLFVEGSIDMDYYEDSYYSPTDVLVKGKMGAYFVDGYLYMMVDGSYKDGEDDLEKVNFKEKLDQKVTQSMWDQVFIQADPDFIEDMIPYQYVDMLDSLDLDEIMDVIPNLKVYKDGNTHSIVFAITKDLALDAVEDVVTLYYEMMGLPSTPQQISLMVTQAKLEINKVVQTLAFTYVISITENRISQVAEKLIFKSVDGNIDIDMTTVITFGNELPKFPKDLDKYEAVDMFGQDIIEKDSLAKK